MRKCVIWSGGDSYEAIINQIKFEELKGNLNCAAILSKSMARFIKRRDGYAIIGKEDLNNIEFDYLIIAAKDYYKEILAEAVAMGYSPRKNNQLPCIANSELRFKQVRFFTRKSRYNFIR